MSYQIKFIEDCLAIAGLLFLSSAAHFYQQEKIKGNKLTFHEIMNHTSNKWLESSSNFFLTTGKTLAHYTNPSQLPVEKYCITSSISDQSSQSLKVLDTKPTAPVIHHAQNPYKKEIYALNKQINFVKQIISTDTLLTLTEKNILSELAKECETKLEHLSYYIKKNMTEKESFEESNNDQSIKLFDDYVTKKVISVAENILELTLRLYKMLTAKEYPIKNITSTLDILTAIKDINNRLKAFIV